MSQTSTTTPKQTIPKPIRFLFGGGAGYGVITFIYTFIYILINIISFNRMAATCFVQPLDLIKNRMQLSGDYFSFNKLSQYFEFN